MDVARAAVETASVIQHSSGSNEYGTPAEYAQRIHYTLGGIDTDPASSRLANKVIRARRIFTKHTNGLDKHWLGRVYVNPPGNEGFDPRSPRERHLGGGLYVSPVAKARAAIWWAKLVHEFQKGRTDEGMFMGFTLEVLRAAQNACALQPNDFAWCYPRSRIKFDDISGAERKPAKSPGHANVLVLLARAPETLGRFREAFSSVGRCFGRCYGD